jgi:hypothetical protein
MSGKFSNGNLVRGLLELDNLLIHELRALVNYNIRIHWTGGFSRHLGSIAHSRQGDSSKATGHGQNLGLMAVPALYVESGGL